MAWIESLFGKEPRSRDADPEYSAAVDRAEKALTGLAAGEAKFLACVAILMARVAHADSEIGEGEKKKILDVLKTQMGLTSSRASAVCSVAVESALTGATDLHIVLRRMNELASREQKLLVVRALFHVATVDDISQAENAEIDQIASGLVLTRADFIALRSEFRDYLALLKNLPG